ncbi:MAG: hypothetical protein A3A86_06800 [Elusimicrobia bacterium RIFCSPLOWO2_01_FULL_60_11]|nr:MAG: hypothetical protein A3A86_06800 [Elusimicrobia bacterium RIFCSPLOWO2_01_FULL_60_11]
MKNIPTVLVADDELEIRNVLQRYLIRQGYEPILAKDGKEALGKSRVQKPDVILLDIMMPGMDGLSVCRKLREDPATRLTPVLMLTSRGAVEDKINGLNQGADDYLSKPFDLGELQARIDVLLKRNERLISVNPLTCLPGNASIDEEIALRIKSQGNFAVAYVDVDNFKPYNDVYGYHQGDLLIVWLAKMMQEEIQKTPRREAENPVFLGHVGGDDFILVGEPEGMKDLARRVEETFDKNRGLWYNWWHTRRGYITAKDRMGKENNFPLMTLTIAVSHNLLKKISHCGEVSQILSEIKKFGKDREDKSKSFVMFDRRKD